VKALIVRVLGKVATAVLFSLTIRTPTTPIFPVKSNKKPSSRVFKNVLAMYQESVQAINKDIP